MNKKKFHANPFLFHLLKRMVHYDFVELSKEPNDLELTEHIYDRYKENKEAKFNFNKQGGIKDYAHSIASSIRNEILKQADCYFSEKMLDRFIQEVTVLDRFSSWKEFAQKYENKPMAIKAAHEYMYSPYSKLSDEHKIKLNNDVNMALYPIVLRYKMMKSNLIHETDDFVIKRASTDEIIEIEILARRIYPCSINPSDTKNLWHGKNPNIFYICKDYENLWANINLLPLKDAFCNALREGRIYEDAITVDDIHSVDEKKQVKYIYIEGLACTIKEALFSFAKYFEKMVSSLADVTRDDLIICAIAGSDEGKLLLKSRGFKPTGSTFDHRKNKEYRFWEIAWKDLKPKIAIPENIPLHIVSFEKLTPLNNLEDEACTA